MSKVDKHSIELLRKLASDLQGAPYPGQEFDMELYRIWYEHVQQNVQSALEYLDSQFPSDKKDIDKSIEKIVK